MNRILAPAYDRGLVIAYYMVQGGFLLSISAYDGVQLQCEV